MAGSLKYEELVKQIAEMKKHGILDSKSLFNDPLIYGGLSSGQNMAQAVHRPTPKFSEENMRKMLNSRLGWDVTPGPMPFEFMHSRKLNETEAVVFVIHNGQALTLKDELALYPSDALITQIRLLADSK